MQRARNRILDRSAVAPILGLVAFVASACTSPGLVRADDDSSLMNRIHFRVECSRSVSNDRITAVVGVTEEDSDAARLSNRVNETMRWAIDRAREVEVVEARSGAYQIHPVHQDGRIRRWRASQDLALASGDVDAVTSLLATLQSRLLVRSVQFGVSTERERAIHEELITECLGAYQERADAIRKALSARGFALVDLSIDQPSGGIPTRRRTFSAQEVASAVAEPAFEAGESELTIAVHATIELER